MHIQWYGMAAFRLQDGEHTVLIDPFGPMEGLPIRINFPPLGSVWADLLLISHEHPDHNGAEVAQGQPHTIRSKAGTFQTPIGPVVGINSEHDPVAGTKRGPNTIFLFTLGGISICHFADFGESHLRPEQREAIGHPDLIFFPAGSGPTIDAAEGARIVTDLAPKWVVPMHYRTPAISFLDPPDRFLAAFDDVRHLPNSTFDLADFPATGHPIALVPASPQR